MTRLRIRVFSAALILGCAATLAAAADWSPISRDEALTRLNSAQPDQRRAALARLAEVGTQQDVPRMLQMLWDDDELVRGMAEQALWGLWMRADDTTADALFQQGIELIHENEIDSAIEKFNQVVALKPEFAEVWNRLGDAYYDLGDTDRALAEYAHALRLNPYHFGVLESCGGIWLERRDARKAAEYFRRALDLNPNLIEAAQVLRELEEKLDNDRI
ncbi:MAG TPA: tetratricopeptide repeat protein [Burkholderiales bacterium]|nr:tetratricopeptide repeat protein [Burkholderiales bacterium]